MHFRDVLTGGNVQGFNFNGNGYVIIDKARFNPSKNTRFKVKFKSMAPDGLLFLMGDVTEKDFMSVQLKQGKVVLMVSLCLVKHMCLT